MNPNQPPPYGSPPPFPPVGIPPHHLHQAPIPRDHDQATLSELLPFSSKKIRLWRSPIVWLAIVAALVSAFLLFIPDTILGPGLTGAQRLDHFTNFAFVSILFFVLAVQLLAYMYARPNKTVLFYMWAFLFMALLLWLPYVAEPFFFIFRNIVPGTDFQQLGPNPGFLATFWAMFWGAGLMEELMKAVPILIGAAVAISIRRQQVMPSPVKRWFAIRGPLDGVLLGIFAGGGFILIETANQYVPNIVIRTYNNSGDLQAAFMEGLFLLVPRVIRSLAGHMGYAAVFGYFIGLAVIRRRQSIRLILIGWLAASFIHAIWNSLGAITTSTVPQYVWATLSAFLGAAALLKARQIHQSMYGETPETQGSIIIDRSGAGTVPLPAPAPAFAPAGAAPFSGYAPLPAPAPHAGYGSPPHAGYAPPPQPSVPAAAQPFAGYASNAATPLPAPMEPAETETVQSKLALFVAGQWLALEVGTIVDLGSLPALAGRADGLRGEVVAHPSRPGVLGLRNSGSAPWTAYLRDGTSQQIDRDQNIRLAPGVRVDFGGGLIGDVVPRA